MTRFTSKESAVRLIGAKLDFRRRRPAEVGPETKLVITVAKPNPKELEFVVEELPKSFMGYLMDRPHASFEVPALERDNLRAWVEGVADLMRTYAKDESWWATKEIAEGAHELAGKLFAKEEGEG